MAHTHVVHEDDHVHTTTGGDSGMGFLLGVIILIAVLFLFFYFGLPALRGGTTNPQINVPSKVDVNYQQK